MSGIATAVEASMGLSCGNKTPFLTNPSHIYPRCNKGALRVLWVLGSSIEFTCSVYRSLLNIQTFPFLQYSVIWITSGRSLGIKDLGNQHYILWWCFARTCLSGPSLSFSQIVLAQVSKLFQWLELAMPFWLHIHDLFCSDVHLFLAVHLSCPEEHHVLWAISIKPIDQALLVALPTLQPFSWLFSASTWLLHLDSSPSQQYWEAQPCDSISSHQFLPTEDSYYSGCWWCWSSPAPQCISYCFRKLCVPQILLKVTVSWWVFWSKSADLSQHAISLSPLTLSFRTVTAVLMTFLYVIRSITFPTLPSAVSAAYENYHSGLFAG